MKYFLNISNHPTSKWSEEQLNAAKKYGEIIDIPFPNISPNATRQEVQKEAFTLFESIHKLYTNDNVTIHIMGEMTFVYSFVTMCILEYTCLASTTERVVVENPDGSKTSIFKFIKFREY